MQWLNLPLSAAERIDPPAAAETARPCVPRPGRSRAPVEHDANPGRPRLDRTRERYPPLRADGYRGAVFSVLLEG